MPERLCCLPRSLASFIFLVSSSIPGYVDHINACSLMQWASHSSIFKVVSPHEDDLSFGQDDTWYQLQALEFELSSSVISGTEP